MLLFVDTSNLYIYLLKFVPQNLMTATGRLNYFGLKAIKSSEFE